MTKYSYAIPTSHRGQESTMNRRKNKVINRFHDVTCWFSRLLGRSHRFNLTLRSCIKDESFWNMLLLVQLHFYLELLSATSSSRTSSILSAWEKPINVIFNFFWWMKNNSERVCNLIRWDDGTLNCASFLSAPRLIHGTSIKGTVRSKW